MEKLSNNQLISAQGGTIGPECAYIIDAMLASDNENAWAQAAYIITSSIHFTC